MLLASMPLLVDLVVNPVYDYPIHILLASSNCDSFFSCN